MVFLFVFSVKGYVRKGILLQAMQQYDPAMDAFQSAIALEEKNPVSLVGIGIGIGIISNFLYEPTIVYFVFVFACNVFLVRFFTIDLCLTVIYLLLLFSIRGEAPCHKLQSFCANPYFYLVIIIMWFKIKIFNTQSRT